MEIKCEEVVAETILSQIQNIYNNAAPLLLKELSARVYKNVRNILRYHKYQKKKQSIELRGNDWNLPQLPTYDSLKETKRNTDKCHSSTISRISSN